MIVCPFGSTRVRVSVIGQGTWHMGEDKRIRRDEVTALRLGIELGLTHIDVTLTPEDLSAIDAEHRR